MQRSEAPLRALLESKGLKKSNRRALDLGKYSIARKRRARKLDPWIQYLRWRRGHAEIWQELAGLSVEELLGSDSYAAMRLGHLNEEG